MINQELRAREEFCAAKADVWALGVIFVAMLTRTLPWDESLISDYDYAYYKHCDPNHLLSRFDISPELNNVLKRIFCDPDIRMNISELRDEIEKIETFGPGNHLAYDIDLDQLQKKIERRFGPRRTLLLPLQLDLLHKDANTILWAFPSKLEQIPSKLDSMNDRAADVRRRADLYLNELIETDPCRRNNRCQYRAGRIIEVLDIIENRFDEIRAYQAQHALPLQAPGDLTSAALKIVTNLLSPKPGPVRPPRPSSRDIIDSYPIVMASSNLSSEPSFASPIPAGMFGPQPYTQSGSSAEESAGPVTPEMTTTDINAAALPNVAPPGKKVTSIKVKKSGAVGIRDPAEASGSGSSSADITCQFPKPPAATFAPTKLTLEPVPVTKLPPLRAPSPPFWFIPLGSSAWTDKPKPKVPVKRMEKSKLQMEVKLPDKPKPPPTKRSPTSSQRIFQAAVRFLANPKPKKTAAA